MFKNKKIYLVPSLGFLAIILVITLFLKLPLCNKTNISTIDAIFEATSAVTDTGSSVKDLSQQFTFWGQLILLLAMEIGAIGFMLFFSVLFVISKKKIKLSDTLFLGSEINISNYSSLKVKAKKIIKYTFSIEFIGICLLAIRFIPMYGLKNGLWYSVFHTVSAFCNAGLDIFGSNSLVLFKNDIYVNCVLIFLMTAGSIGFFVLEDLVGWFYSNGKNKIHMESKLILTTSGILILTAIILMKIFNSELTILQATFSVVTSRNTGLYTIEMNSLSQFNQFLICIIMFIGGAPGSNAGGIRVIVFAILVLTTIANIKNREEVVAFYRRIDDKTVKKAITILCIDLLIVWIGIIGITLTEHQGLLDTLFYVTSNFSNTGLTTIDINDLSFLGKCISIFIMYLGKIAPITFVSLFITGHPEESGIKYSSMDTVL